MHCASCGSSQGVEMHHLVPRIYGGGNGPTVPLCGACHGAAHDCRRPKDVGALTRAGIVKAKARGAKLGRQPGAKGSYYLPNAQAGGAAAKRKADAFAAEAGPTVRALRAQGLALRAVAAALTVQGVRAPRGGAWTAAAVRNVLARLPAEAEG